MRPFRRRPRGGGAEARQAEAVCAFGVLLAAAWVTFGTARVTGVESVAAAPYWLLPILAWIAVRLGPAYTAAAAAVAAFLGVVAAVLDAGIFGQLPYDHRTPSLLSFLAVVSTTSIALVVLQRHRDSAAGQARQLSDELDDRVRQRTGELAGANERLLERSRGLEAANRALEEQASAMRAQQLAALNLAEDARQAQQMAVKAERALAQQAGELRIARDVAETATRTKSNFLATMSHEIRTPMNGILGMTDLLLESRLTTDQREQLLTMQRSGQALLSIINDILDFSKVEAGKLQVERLRVDVRPAIDDIIRLLQLRAVERGLTLSVDYSAGVPEAIETDPGRLRQVLTNLVGNAIKFTTDGYVRVIVDTSAGGRQLRFQIIDTGPGIPVDARTQLFQPFSQLDASTARRFGGTGLGLAICRQLVELLGGEIGVISPVTDRPAAGGPGSIFWFSLPAVPIMESRRTGTGAELAPVSRPSSAAPAPAPATASRTAPGGAPSICRVLVAEDNTINQTVIRAMLRKLGIEPTIVGDGKQAVEALARTPCDLVLMDCQMPVMDGFEATREIRSRPGPGPLIVAVTANAMAGDADRCRAAGMDDYISKPISVGELRRVLAPWLDRENAA